jgi:hypothetical protein
MPAVDRKLLSNALHARQANASGPLNEAAYLALWQSHVAPINDPFRRSVVGGVWADRLSWVFAAGYQVAVRSVFAVDSQHWIAYAASEDRSGTLPAVRVAQADGVARLTGCKTWVAAIEHVGELVVRLNTVPAEYYLVSRESEGLKLTVKPEVTFLSDLSQGSAEFSDVAARRLPVTETIPFSVREALAIYGALCGLVLAQPTLKPFSETCVGLVDTGAELWDLALGDQTEIDLLKAFDQRMQEFIVTIEDQLAAVIPGWSRDQRLVSMYSPGIARYEL